MKKDIYVIYLSVRLTDFTDYALRVLMHLGLGEGRQSSIADIARAYGISEAHLMKVAHRLGQLGYLATARGRGGGLRLARPPESIRIGALVRAVEPDLALAECFGPHGACAIAGPCRLQPALAEAREAFLAALDRYTLDDLLWPHALALRARLGVAEAPAA